MRARYGSPRARLVEVVGPAGAGKSALAEAYCARDPVRRRLESLWGLPRTFLLAGGAALLPTMAAAALSGRPMNPEELTHRIRIEALRRAVAAARAQPACLVLMDEGWLFGMSWLEVFHPAAGESARELWRTRQIEYWSRQLDAVILLDADDAVLAQRIRTRAKPHPVKASGDEEIRSFTARFRHAFERVVRDVRAAGRVASLDLRTDHGVLADHVDRLHAALDGIEQKGTIS